MLNSTSRRLTCILLFFSCQAALVSAQDQRSQTNEASTENAIRALDAKLDLILRRLDSLQSQVDSLKLAREPSTRPIRRTPEQEHRATSNGDAGTTRHTFSWNIEAGMRIDAMQRTENRKLINLADPVRGKLVPRENNVLIEDSGAPSGLAPRSRNLVPK